jgi:hypothetical protein
MGDCGIVDASVAVAAERDCHRPCCEAVIVIAVAWLKYRQMMFLANTCPRLSFYL